MVADYLPKPMNTRLLQHLYVSGNPYNTGSKDFLDDAGDVSSYTRLHREIHPVFRDFLQKFGYYDIFLLDSESGAIVYTVFKEVDVGTSLMDGPYADTGLARVFRKAQNARSPDFVAIDDFEPYHPSYNAPAAFIASPIFDGDQQIGVLAFQMPIDRINLIMTNDQSWSEVGLGESGETYIVADDFRLRNQSRFLIEDSENYFLMIERMGTPGAIVEQIRNLNSSIGLQEVLTEGTRAALAGQTDTRIFDDYRGVSVLSSFRPLEIHGLDWVIMSEIDEAEAFAAIGELFRKLMLTVVLLLVFAFVAAMVISRTITRPLARLSENSRALANGNLTVQIDTTGSDEIGDLSRDFEHMRQSLKKVVNELEELNAGLEQKVADRTAELEASERQLAKANQRMMEELNFARDIQMGMLPLLFPAFPNRPELHLDALLEPAREVGGDFYDFYFLDENRLCLVVADVSGKGAPAALYMAVSKTLIKSRAAHDFDPSSILTQVNGELAENNTTSTFVTIFLAILDVSNGEFAYCNAGHNPPYIKRISDRLEQLEELHGPILGVLPNLTYTMNDTILTPGDMLVMYTDGVTESMNERDEEYTDQRLADLLSNTRAQIPNELTFEILEDVRSHQGNAEQSDDITLLALQYHGARPEDGDHLEVRIKNRMPDIDVVEERFHEFATSNGISEKDRQTMSMVMDELLNNVISYAYPKGGDHVIVVDMTLKGSRLVLMIEDDGIPFNPFKVEEPDVGLSVEERGIGGLGIHLVRETMDEYHYQRRANKNIVILVKELGKPSNQKKAGESNDGP
jgi:serine phosphatase RsbU (regulator of sigma subunit)/anti-sigma regulatory factor (Ser/Thr protein kinase)